MRKKLNRLFHTFMALVVLISSSGFGLIEHSCAVKGKSTALHRTNSSCCAKHSSQKNDLTNKTKVQKTKCCTEQQKFENVEYSSSASQFVAKFVQTTLNSIKEAVFDFTVEVLNAIVETIANYQKESALSALSGKQVRIFVQSFII